MIVVVDCCAADDEQRRITDSTSDEYSTSFNSDPQQDCSRYLADVDLRQWNDAGSHLTSADNSLSLDLVAEQLSGSLVIGSPSGNVPRQARLRDSNHCSTSLCEDGADMSTTRTSGNRAFSAMKLKCGTDSRQQASSQDYNNHISPNPDLSAPQPILLATPSPGLSAQQQIPLTSKPSSPSQPVTSRSRRLLSNEPLGAEFDVKQIKVRQATDSSSSPAGEFDFFADMAPNITSSSDKSLLELLSSAAAANAAETSSTQPTSRLSITNVSHLDTAVSCCNMYSFFIHDGVCWWW